MSKSDRIYTRHHRVFDAIDADQVYFTPPRGGAPIHYSEKSSQTLEKLNTYFHLMTDQPRFVIDDDVMSLANSSECHRSILDMKRAGVFRLPYPNIVVEIRRSKSTSIITMWEPKEKTSVIHGNNQVDVYGHVCRLHEVNAGSVLIVAPSTSGILISDCDGQPWAQLGAVRHDLLRVDDSDGDDLIAKTYDRDGSEVALALFAVMLLMATEGIEREVIDCDKLNKRRAATNRPTIPRHTYLYIKKVYRSSSGEQSDEYDPRRSPRPHWRRGHIRGVRYGAGREKIKQMYIKPRLVAYHGDAVVPDEPRTPDYRVRT